MKEPKIHKMPCTLISATPIPIHTMRHEGRIASPIELLFDVVVGDVVSTVARLGVELCTGGDVSRDVLAKPLLVVLVVVAAVDGVLLLAATSGILVVAARGSLVAAAPRSLVAAAPELPDVAAAVAGAKVPVEPSVEE